jgi:hypothetical protein
MEDKITIPEFDIINKIKGYTFHTICLTFNILTLKKRRTERDKIEENNCHLFQWRYSITLKPNLQYFTI